MKSLQWCFHCSTVNPFVQMENWYLWELYMPTVTWLHCFFVTKLKYFTVMLFFVEQKLTQNSKMNVMQKNLFWHAFLYRKKIMPFLKNYWNVKIHYQKCSSSAACLMMYSNFWKSLKYGKIIVNSKNACHSSFFAFQFFSKYSVIYDLR